MPENDQRQQPVNGVNAPAPQNQAANPPTNPMPGDPPKPDHWDKFLSLLPYLGVIVLGIIGVGLAAAIVWGLFSHDSIVREFASADLARGVITFIFAVGTIGIALLLTVGALVGKYAADEFAKAKEVLTLLIGVFGTISGFYFGTAIGGGAQKLDVAEIQVADKQIMTHVVGGTRPYRYSITGTEKGFTPVTDQVSKDGWIIQQLPAIPKTGSITVDVMDSHDLKGSRERKLSTETPAASPTPTPSASGTTTQSSPQQ